MQRNLLIFGSLISSFSVVANEPTLQPTIETTFGLRGSYVLTEFYDHDKSSASYGLEGGVEYDIFDNNRLIIGFDAYFETGKYHLSHNNSDVNFDSFAFTPKVHTFLSDNLDVYLKAGIANWTNELEATTSYSGYAPIVGLGSRYHFAPKAYVGIEINHQFQDDQGVDFYTTYFTGKVGYRF